MVDRVGFESLSEEKQELFTNVTKGREVITDYYKPEKLESVEELTETNDDESKQ